MEVDRISNLPSEVTDEILSRLPINDAVRTSILSTNWRYKASKLPYLDFNPQDCVSTRKGITFVNIVDHLFLHHVGPIHTFKLCNDEIHIPDWHIDDWTIPLCRKYHNTMKHFVVDLCHRYKMPSCFYSCQDLVDLELTCCLLQPPPTFKGFKSLVAVDIRYCILEQDVVKNLIAGSPLLKSFIMKYCNDCVKHLDINAPNLKSLSVRGAFEQVNFENTLKLTNVCVNMEEKIPRAKGQSSNLVQLFDQLPHVERLKIKGFFLQYLIGHLPAEQSGRFLHLKSLYIDIHFTDGMEILFALDLLMCSPALQDLTIVVLREKDDAVVDEKVDSRIDGIMKLYFRMNQLRFVKITGCVSEAQSSLIKLLLFTAPALERMTIVYASKSWKLVENLLKFRRASAKAEITYSIKKYSIKK